MTISLTTLGLIVADRETNTLSDFLVSPIRRGKLMTSYLASSFIVCFVMISGFVLFFQVFFLIAYGTSFTLLQVGMIFMTMVGSLVFANVFMLLILSFMKTQQSLSAASAIVGIMSGFVTGAYIPLGMFGETIGNIFSALPFAQITTLSRGAFLHNLENVTPLTHDIISGEIARGFGIELWLGNTHISTWGIVAMSAGITLFLFLFLLMRFAKMKKSD
jgi:multidrug/hemolysin transport system permease protein